MFNLNKINDFEYELPKTGNMNVPGKIYINEKLLSAFSDSEPLKQVSNVASLPGIIKNSIAMPDIHLGYGFPIGGVAAFDYDSGIISPGGVGYDINCGVTLIKTSFNYNDINNKIKDLINEIYKKVPSGIDIKGGFKINNNDMRDILSSGIDWAYKNGYAIEDDKIRTEENGKLECDSYKVSEKALKRGINELGTLGGGNHFLEIQKVDKIYNKEVAKKFGINNEDQIMIMVHTGSRGLGHQVATDFMNILNESCDSVRNENDKQLISTYIGSKNGSDYINAMNAAANFGFNNRQIIVYKIRNAFENIFGKDFESMDIKIVYSLAHNMAKTEEHIIDGKKMKLIVHRKGATRAFPKNHVDGYFHDTGHPVIIPGSMGTASYVLVGTENNINSTFGSSCHGSGRVLSRKKSNEYFQGNNVISKLADKNIYLRAATKKVITEESPDSYKDIDEVINVVNGAGIANPIARMVPLGVMKG